MEKEPGGWSAAFLDALRRTGPVQGAPDEAGVERSTPYKTGDATPALPGLGRRPCARGRKPAADGKWETPPLQAISSASDPAERDCRVHHRHGYDRVDGLQFPWSEIQRGGIGAAPWRTGLDGSGHPVPGLVPTGTTDAAPAGDGGKFKVSDQQLTLTRRRRSSLGMNLADHAGLKDKSLTA